MLELFANWMECVLPQSGLLIHNVQISRYLDDLVTEGFVRRLQKSRTPRYLLTRSGIVEILSRMTTLPRLLPLEQFFFVHYFIENYGMKIDELVREEGVYFPPALRMEVETLRSPELLLQRQLSYLDQEISKLETRVDEALRAAELAQWHLQKGSSIETVVTEIQSRYPYELNNQKPLHELYSEIPKGMREWELTEGSSRRAKRLWRPLLDHLTRHRAVLQKLAGPAIFLASLFSGTFALPPRAEAFESSPEYQSLTENEQSGFEGPGLFGSEYSSDLLSYMKPVEWEYQWLVARNALDLNLGSLSSSHFLIDDRLKVHAPLSEAIEFRFHYTSERDRERDATHVMLEFDFRPLSNARWLGVALYGEPSLYKRENDTGIALVLQPSERHEIRIFNTFVDVTRLKRTDRNDNFVEPHLPYSRGIVGRLWSDPDLKKGEFLEYAVRYETTTEWLFPDEGYLYRYWKAFAYMYGNLALNDRWSAFLRLQFDRKFESRERTDPQSTATEDTWRTDRYFALARATLHRLGPNEGWTLSPGIEFAQRDWYTGQGDVIYRDLLPHLEWTLPGFSRGNSQDLWRLMYVATWHRAFGPIELRDPQDVEPAFEQRLNVSYEFRFGDQASLLLMATGDLDEFFTRKSWDGGSGMFRLNF